MKFEVFWKNTGYMVRPELKENIKCDYLIIGGGITGVSTAYFLSQLGAKNIVLIEKNQIASGATGKAAGTLVLRGEIDLLSIIKDHSHEKVDVYWKEIHEGLKGIKRVINDENIDYDTEPQNTLYCSTENTATTNYLLDEYNIEKNIETTTKFLEGKEFKKELNTDFLVRGILSANHGLSVNPLKLTQNLSKVIEKYGVRVYENTRFLGSENNKAKTHHGDIQYKKMILAIDSDHPSKEIIKNKSTIAITRPLTKNELEETGMVKRKIVFDDDPNNNYYYFKVTKEERLLFGFGNIIVHKKHNKTDPHFPHLKDIENFIKKLFPYLNLEPEYAWAGSFGITKDYDPLIEFNGDTISIAGAGSQVTCFMAAKHIAYKILGQKSSLEDFFTD